MYPPVQIVNEYDELVGGADLIAEALPQGLIRRVVHIFIFDPEGCVFLQRRGPKVKHPGLFETSAGGHVDLGESYHEAAQKELFEELNLSLPLAMHGTYFGQHPMEGSSNGLARWWAALFTGRVETRESIVCNPEEVDGGLWYDGNEVAQLIAQQPERFTLSLPMSWRIVRALTGAEPSGCGSRSMD